MIVDETATLLDSGQNKRYLPSSMENEGHVSPENNQYLGEIQWIKICLLVRPLYFCH